MRRVVAVGPAAPPRAVDAGALDRAIEWRVNAHRRSLGLGPLAPHPALAAAARQHSHRMRNLGFFAHTDPRDGTSSQHRVGAVDRHAWVLVAENLAAGPGSAEEIVSGWLRSPGHRANIEHPDLTHVGTGTSLGGERLAYTTQVYGRPWTGPRLVLPDSWQDLARRVARRVRTRLATLTGRRWS